MRIALVSAHYPPNFVSGGTLVPYRLAEGYARAGHEVGVFTGWLGDRPEGTVTDEVDGRGIAIRWFATFHGWGDRRNFDHPPAAASFGEWLDRTKPDLVHFHSIQTLGAGLVDEAKSRRLPTVVTLHDFWWWCARQFLCDRDYRPCSLAVDAGTCSCEVDRAFLDDRNAFTTERLGRVDRIVAVSESAASVARANGADPAKLSTIPNGLPADGRGERAASHSTAPERPGPGTSQSSGDVRLVYAGGSDRMKGSEVIFAAARRLAEKHADGWALDAYGCEEMAGRAAGLPVKVRAAYKPEQLGGVLAGADVLVVPSLMRETYSILTREALSAGVPVICSDSLGPEEVVTHGRNGLVVPTGDIESLAEAMRRVVQDADLRRRLTAGCASVALPTVSEQIDAHLKLYSDLLADRESPPAAARRSIRRVLFVVGIDGAPLRYRAWLPAEGLRALGVHVDLRQYQHPQLEELGRQADAIVVYRVPATHRILDFTDEMRRLGKPLVFDVDDLIFEPGLSAEIPALSLLPEEEAALWLEGVRRYRTTMERCDAFVGSTEALCAHAASATGLPTFRFANGVGRRLAKLSDSALVVARRPGPLRIAYLSGTNTHDRDWAAVEPAVAQVLASHPTVELWLVGLIEPSSDLARFGGRIRRLGMQPWESLPGILRDIDVNLAPMEMPNLFNEAKSAIKWLEAAMVETPTVASPTQPFSEAITSDVNGVLAGTVEEWAEALSTLLDDELTRRRLGARARRDALLRYAPLVQGRRYLEILEAVAPRSDISSGWEPVVNDEPVQTVELTPYFEASGGRSRPALLRIWVGRGARGYAKVRTSLAEQGAAATARRVSRYAARRVVPLLPPRVKRTASRFRRSGRPGRRPPSS